MKSVRIFCISLAVIVGILWVHCMVVGEHMLYDGLSMGYAFATSLLVVFLAFHASIVGQVASVLISLFITQRVITTYLFPREFDYNLFVQFTHDQIRYTALFILACVFMIAVGIGIGTIVSARNARFAVLPPTYPTSARWISFFGIQVNLQMLVKAVCILIIPLYAYKFYAILSSGLGITGRFYDETEALQIWLQNIPDAFGPVVVFSFFYYRTPDPVVPYARIAFCFVVMNGLVLASKSVLVSLVFSYWLLLQIARRRPTIVVNAIVVGSVLFSLVVVFPIMTTLRGVLITAKEEVYTRASMSTFNGDIADEIFTSLRRISLWEPTALWLTMSRSDIPPNASFNGEVLSILNRLRVGRLIAQPEAVDLSKLMEVMGRGYGDTQGLGGGGANVGVYATAWLYFDFFGCLYFGLWAWWLLLIERSRLHPLHKYTIFISYLVTPLVGGNSLIMPHAFLWYLLFIAAFSFLIMFLFARDFSGVSGQAPVGKGFRPLTGDEERPNLSLRQD